MIQLLVLLCIGCVIIMMAVRALLRMTRTSTVDLRPAEGELSNLLKLRALSFKNFPRLFSDSDYRELRTEPKLVRTAEHLRRQRKRLALQWLGALRSDVLDLWRMRRLLIAYGVSQGVGLELATAIKVASILLFISVLRTCIFIFGPFSFQRIASFGNQQVEIYTRSCRAALGRLPSNKWAQFSTEWRTHQSTA